MITRTYLGAALAAILLIIGATVLVTGVITSSTVGTPIVVGTSLTIAGILAVTVTGYRSIRHHITDQINRAVARLVRDIVAHDVRLATARPDTTVVQLDGAQARRLNRESTT
ncbi:hypothetical protein [Streptomyces sp. NPDC048489]|uniref:hypothetical protein n=1 Tax=Streptomyces sp. NPDC048489 TaxID=3154504 RepID=UPI003418B109